MEPRIWLIAGPTASGKSALALRLAQQAGGEIVNADALQLYRDLRVLTARPSVEEEAQVPHHLFGMVDAAEGWSVGRWLRAALAAIGDIHARGRPAVLVGGTGLYFRALTQGLAEVPQTPAEVRAAAAAEFEAMGEAAFRERLRAADPAAEARINPADRQRLTRACIPVERFGRIHRSMFLAASIGMVAYTTGAIPGPRQPDKGTGKEPGWLALPPPAKRPTSRSSCAMSSMASAAAPEG